MTRLDSFHNLLEALGSSWLASSCERQRLLGALLLAGGQEEDLGRLGRTARLEAVALTGHIRAMVQDGSLEVDNTGCLYLVGLLAPAPELSIQQELEHWWSLCWPDTRCPVAPGWLSRAQLRTVLGHLISRSDIISPCAMWSRLARDVRSGAKLELDLTWDHMGQLQRGEVTVGDLALELSPATSPGAVVLPMRPAEVFKVEGLDELLDGLATRKSLRGAS